MLLLSKFWHLVLVSMQHSPVILSTSSQDYYTETQQDASFLPDHGQAPSITKSKLQQNNWDLQQPRRHWTRYTPTHPIFVKSPVAFLLGHFSIPYISNTFASFRPHHSTPQKHRFYIYMCYLSSLVVFHVLAQREEVLPWHGSTVWAVYELSTSRLHFKRDL